MSRPARAPAGHDRLVTPELVLMAHRVGVRPAARGTEARAVRWVEPPSPTLLPVERLTLAPCVLRAWRDGGFGLTVDHATAAVIEHSTAPADWLSGALADAHCELARQGRAHSIECWRDGQLVGGLYGITIGAVLFTAGGFGRTPAALDAALGELAARLLADGFRLLDLEGLPAARGRLLAPPLPRRVVRAALAAAMALPADLLPSGRSPALGVPRATGVE